MGRVTFARAWTFAAGGVLVSALTLAAGPTPVVLLDTPAGPESGMYALSPQTRPFRNETITELEPILSWLEPLAEGGHVLRFSVLDGNRWSTPGEVARGANWFANWADHPSVVRLPDSPDTLLAHWLVRSGDGTSRYGYGLRIAKSIDGGRRWLPEFSAEPENAHDYAGFAAFSLATSMPGAAYLAPRPGHATAAAHDPSHGGAAAEPPKALLYTHLLSDGRRTTEVLDAETCSCCSIALASTSRGSVVAYRDRTPGEVRDIAVVRWRDGRWSSPTTVHEDGWVIPGCPTNGPAISAEQDRVAVAWFTAAGGRPRVRVAFSADGGGSFAPPIDVDGGAPIGWTGVVLTADGDAIVSWLEGRSGGEAQVRLRRVREDGRAGAPLVVADTAAGRATGIPQLSRSGNRLVLAWRDGRVRSALVPIDTVELPRSVPAPAR